MPPHELYVEAFVGGGAILRHKAPARSSIAIDRDPVPLAALANCGVQGLELLHGDALELLPTFPLMSSSLVYADPPYVLSTLSGGRPLYRYSMTDEDHVRLLQLLVSLPCMVMISGYPSALYDGMLTGWRTLDFWAMTRSGKPALERLWMNYPEPWELHDYRHLGTGFRERERIKRKKLRWQKKLMGLPALERWAILSALQDITSPEL